MTVGRREALSANCAADGAATEAAVIRLSGDSVGAHRVPLVRQLLQVRCHGRLQLHVVAAVGEPQLIHEIVLELRYLLAYPAHILGGSLKPIPGHGSQRLQLVLIASLVGVASGLISGLPLHDAAVLVIEVTLELFAAHRIDRVTFENARVTTGAPIYVLVVNLEHVAGTHSIDALFTLIER